MVRKEIREKERQHNIAEETFIKEARRRGFNVLRRGWPDFIVSGKNAIYFVEVKSNNDQPSEFQKKTFAKLESMGYEVLISRNGEWIQPSILLNPARLIYLVDTAKYFMNKLTWLKGECITLTAEIERETARLDQVENRLIRLKRKVDTYHVLKTEKAIDDKS